ncbi:MAG: protein phosphatase 2C domain-containing protein [Planctomycetota bacterium]|nr:protein phosphatase 2C domain-containing protein [Planctomycetota bacterium]
MVERTDTIPDMTPPPPRFEVAAGSVLGRDHVLAGRNNQDACCCQRDEHGLVAVVCDGCSSGKHSEVGAKLGARLLVEALRRRLPELDAGDPATILEAVRQEILRQLDTLVSAMGAERVPDVNAYFLFTILGAAVTSQRAVVLALGDGLVFLNGKALPLPPSNNRPPYLAYGLIEHAVEGMRPETFRFRVVADIPAADVTTLVLATDGAGKLCGGPGSLARQGCDGLREFWLEDRYFTNPQALTRRLVQLNRDVRTVDWEARRVDRRPGLLLDDTTLVVIRRQRIVARASGPCAGGTPAAPEG